MSLRDGQPDSEMMPGMTSQLPRHGRQSPGWHWLKRFIITATVLLSPVFFTVMFLTVTTLLRPSFGWWAWTVPVATEGCFVIAYLLGILLEWAGKPMTWLRAVPWLFAAASLVLNVWASLGDVPGMIGHAVVTVAFFLPLIAGEAAVRSLSRSEDDLRLSAEQADARRYALDLVRDRKGRLWRLRVPSLLRVQILHARPPAAVADAVADGARYGGAVKWESAVEQWIADGLTRGEKMAVTVQRAKRVIEASVTASEESTADSLPARQTAGRKAASTRAQKAKRVRELLADDMERTRPEIAALAGVSVATVDRIKATMPTPIRGRAAAR